MKIDPPHSFRNTGPRITKSTLVKCIGIPLSLVCAGIAGKGAYAILTHNANNPYSEKTIVSEYKDVCFTNRTLSGAKSQIRGSRDSNGLDGAYNRLVKGKGSGYEAEAESETRKRAIKGLEKAAGSIDRLIEQTGEDLARLEKNDTIKGYKNWRIDDAVRGVTNLFIFAPLALVCGLATKFIASRLD